jgi:hypothetical protein
MAFDARARLMASATHPTALSFPPAIYPGNKGTENGEVKSRNHLLGTSTFLSFRSCHLLLLLHLAFTFISDVSWKGKPTLHGKLEKVFLSCKLGRGPGRPVHCSEAKRFHGSLCLPSIFFFHLLLKFLTILRNEETRSKTDWKCERI